MSPAIKPVTPPLKSISASMDASNKMPIQDLGTSAASRSRTSSASSMDGNSASGSYQSNGAQALGGANNVNNSSGSANQSLAELAKAREERRRQLKEQEANYIAFSGAGRRVDEKPPKAPSSSTSTIPPSSSPNPSPPISFAAGTTTEGLAVKNTSSKWKEKKSKAAAFYGSGHTLS